MWVTFVIGCLFLAFVLFLPGYLALKPTGLDASLRLACSPLASAFLFLVIAAFMSLASVRTSLSWLILVASMIAISAIISFAIRTTPEKKAESKPNGIAVNDGMKHLAILAVYYLFGIAAATLFYAMNLDGANSFAQLYDNYSHLNGVRDLVDANAFFSVSEGIYPQAWQGIAALCASFLDGEVTVGMNALNFTIIALVYPSAVFAFLSIFQPGNCRILIAGAILSPAFFSFPWSFIIFGPLYPNLIGYSMLPMAAFLLSSIFQNGIGKTARAARAASFATGLAALFFLHQSAIFVGIVIMTPYCCSLLLSLKLDKAANAKRQKLLRYCLCAGFALFVVMVWCILYKMPALSSTVHFTWSAFLSPVEGIASFLTLALAKDLNVMLSMPAPQIVLALLVLIGAVRCIITKTGRWAVVAYAICGAMYVINVSTDGTLKQVLTGFWYTDSYRIAAMASIAATPLAATGLVSVYEALERAFGSQKKASYRPQLATTVLAGALAILFVVSTYLPCTSQSADGSESGNAGIDTAFGILNSKTASAYSLECDSNPLDSCEIDFIEQAKSMIPENAVVINIPHDGSMFAYGETGINVRYRSSWFDYPEDINAKGDADGIIRSRLCDIAKDPEVRNAVEEIGAEYVLLLDQGNQEPRAIYNEGGVYRSQWWTGISEITDETPGFDIVLEQGDMRLYRIER